MNEPSHRAVASLYVMGKTVPSRPVHVPKIMRLEHDRDEQVPGIGVAQQGETTLPLSVQGHVSHNRTLPDLSSIRRPFFIHALLIGSP